MPFMELENFYGTTAAPAIAANSDTVDTTDRDVIKAAAAEKNTSECGAMESNKGMGNSTGLMDGASKDSFSTIVDTDMAE
jgi:hypothetical protein